ncbi:hypothetical protein [Ideonella sp.]|uniref:hypothetical protein n=1 Tax=Ideonella sp. TaxID=1929293 RepID=UPI0035B1C07B
MPPPDELTAELCARAARWVVDEGMDYPGAKRRAQRELGQQAARMELPSNEAVEDAVREHIALFHADTQPGELRALRELALHWMARLAEFRPHLGGAAWRGTATRLSDLRIDLYCDDPKATEIEFLNQGIDFDSHDAPGDAQVVLTVHAPCRALGETVGVHFLIHDHDALRGALKPDTRGRSWRGDAAALRRLLAQDDTP